MSIMADELQRSSVKFMVSLVTGNPSARKIKDFIFSKFSFRALSSRNFCAAIRIIHF